MINDIIKDFFNTKNNIKKRRKSLIEFCEELSKADIINLKNYLFIFFKELDNFDKKLLKKELTKEEAIDKYLSVRLSIFNKLNKLDKNLIEFLLRIVADELNEFNKEDNSNIITTKEVKEIYNYLIKNFKYFNELSPFEYTIIEYQHNKVNSLSAFDTKFDKNSIFNFFFLNVKDNLSPVYVTFHEFGHYIHTNYSFGKMNIDKKIMNFLENTGFYKINEADSYSQKEALADILAMGMMYDSPYESCDPFVDIPKDEKAIFNKLVKDLLGDIHNESKK